MQAVLKREFISEDDYLAGEQASDVRHEYINGLVYAMAGGSVDHHQIAFNVAFAARSHLKGGSFRVFLFDIKVLLGLNPDKIFYYPDVMVGCDRRDTHKLYLRFPKLILEVASVSTERLDREEKKAAYQTIETLEEYVIIAQDHPHVTIFRRADNWQPEFYTDLSHSVTFQSIGLSLPLAVIYEGVLLK